MKITPEEIKALFARHGKEIPEGLREALDRLGPNAEIEAMELGLIEVQDAITGGVIIAAHADQVQELLEASRAKPLVLGDIVVLRRWAKGRFKWPRDGERCIVTQVLDIPHRDGGDGTPIPARRQDIALAFIDADGDLVEYLHDSRMFKRVGNIEGDKA